VEEEVIQKLNSSPHIEEAHFLFGEWDIIAKVVARDFNGVSKVVLDEIRSLPGVEHKFLFYSITFYPYDGPVQEKEKGTHPQTYQDRSLLFCRRRGCGLRFQWSGFHIREILSHGE
jgi:hypothetical protein